ncbi:copper homeostasis protein CutC [Virgibacillus sp. 179-BFC.A HS]|uniref:PF03932 family protein CutC n=1 Tax=Tigheibacillus jepli TaxID=3035914 RepID=A0ABU5CKF2_9BACI|nr:copper homeostasis protein CutC [Virgibacillus sp. 179-BFC.A HS]MDY0406834.1 copper homeostasis protein CutC [Virgibacillus sp. 179-BFC.A HS]
MKIEAITLNATDTKQAEQLGIDRVELVSAMQEGGLTPSYGVIKNVLESASIPVQIMVRPHSFGFMYDDADWQVIKEDLNIIRSLGGNRIVIGGITAEGQIDEAFLNRVIEHVPDFDITFHRAFDQVVSQQEAYRLLNKYGGHVKRILTSGGKDKAAQATNELCELVTLSHELNGPEILIGSGVSPKNIGMLHVKIGARQYHVGSGIRKDGDFRNGLDVEKIASLKATLHG